MPNNTGSWGAIAVIFACPCVTPAVPYVFMSYKRGVIAYYGTQAVHGVRAPEALGENLVCASP